VPSQQLKRAQSKAKAAAATVKKKKKAGEAAEDGRTALERLAEKKEKHGLVSRGRGAAGGSSTWEAKPASTDAKGEALPGNVGLAASMGESMLASRLMADAAKDEGRRRSSILSTSSVGSEGFSELRERGRGNSHAGESCDGEFGLALRERRQSYLSRKSSNAGSSLGGTAEDEEEEALEEADEWGLRMAGLMRNAAKIKSSNLIGVGAGGEEEEEEEDDDTDKGYLRDKASLNQQLSTLGQQLEAELEQMVSALLTPTPLQCTVNPNPITVHC